MYFKKFFNLFLMTVLALILVAGLNACGGGSGGGGDGVGYTDTDGNGDGDDDGGNNETWAKAFGGNAPDEVYSIEKTSSGEYIVAGNTKSTSSGLVRLTPEAWIVKLDSAGNIIWDIGKDAELERESLRSIKETPDGGFVATGYRWLNDNTANLVKVIRIDSEGKLIWDKYYGGTSSTNEKGYSILVASDGNYIVAGYAGFSNNAWVFKIDQKGLIVWSETYQEDSHAYDIQETSDGGYIVAGYIKGSGFDFWVTKLDGKGNATWSKSFGANNNEIAYSVQETLEGDFVVAGKKESWGYPLYYNIWVVKLDSEGNKIWDKEMFGETSDEEAHSILATTDGNYVLVGYTKPFGSGSDWDVLVTKLNAEGEVILTKTFGGSDDDRAYSVQETPEGGYIIAGHTKSFGTDDSFDGWVIKLDSNFNCTGDGCP